MGRKVEKRKNLRKNIEISPRANDALNAMLDYFEEQKDEGINLVEPTYSAIISESILKFYDQIRSGDYEKKEKIRKLD